VSESHREERKKTMFKQAVWKFSVLEDGTNWVKYSNEGVNRLE